MTALASNTTNTGASSASTKQTWKTINWDQVSIEVKQLQMRIAKAVREKRYGKAKALQWLLTHSFSAKVTAVKRVASAKGAKTPGVDGVIWKTSEDKMKAVQNMQRRGYHPLPLRRIYVPKKQKGAFRPISIPSLGDRSMQSLHLLALEPVMETMADKNAYGFRPKRSCADAISQCFNVLARKHSASFILEGDIRDCFGSLSGEWLKDNILMDKVILSKWLNTGYMEERTLYPTLGGVAQGAPASSIILVLALKGLEEAVKNVTSKKDKVHVVAYADDFIITGSSKEVLEHKIMPVVIAFLKERGLELSPTKTKITHIDTGFDFLGMNVRKYKGKLLIRPSKENVKVFLDKIRTIIKSNATMKTVDLIQILNPRIRGWTNYFRHVVAKKTFSYVDYYILKALVLWISRRHPKKNAQWKYKQYFRDQGMKRWIFSSMIINKKGEKKIFDLFRASQLPIRRHVKVRCEANIYDPEYAEYFFKRENMKKRMHILDKEFLKTKNLDVLQVAKTEQPGHAIGL